jgi:hypothetical protein
MAITLTLNQSNVPFAVKLTDCGDGSIRNISNIAEQRIGFIKQDGTQFDKVATLEADPENPSQIISITNIVGNGIDGIIIATIANTNILKEGEIVSISATTNFDVTNVPLSIIDGTTFSYNLGTVGNATPESTGTATTQGEFLITFINVAPETTPLLDLVGTWHYFGKVKQTDDGVFATSEAVIFHVEPYNSSF